MFKCIKQYFERPPEPQETTVYLVYLIDPDLGPSPFNTDLPRSPFYQEHYFPPVVVEEDRA
jgi:hypothetical protein